VIILSLAVFDRVKAEGVAASAEPDARNGPDLSPRPRLRLRVTRSEIAIHEFGRHRHHDQSKNPADHTTGSKLAPWRAVLKFNLDAIPPRDNAKRWRIAGIFQPFARLRWIRFGLLMRAVNSRAATLNAASAAKYQMFRCAPSPTPISDFRVSAFPLSPIRQWFR
jgi:hypothetical protein